MLRIGTLSFLLGIILIQQLPELPYYSLSVFLPVLIFIVFRRGRTSLRALAAFTSGLLWATATGYWLTQESVPQEVVGRSITVTGYIADIPRWVNDSFKFEFDITHTDLPADQKIPQKIRLSWRHEHVQPKVGELWKLTVRLKPPRGFYNPGSFEYENWLAQKHIRGIGYVVQEMNERIEPAQWHRYTIAQTRATLAEQLESAIGERPYSRVILALVLGIQNLTEADWEMLRQTGTTHLLAISGMHLSLIAGFVFLLTRWAWSRSAYLTNKIAAARVAALFALCIAVLYALLAGFGIPVQRALIMVGVVFAGLSGYRQYRAGDLLAFALLLVLIVDPLAVLASGFWLSFGAVAIIFYSVYGKVQQHQPWWRSLLQIQIAISLGLAPVLILIFGQISLISPVANLVAVPVVSFIIMPLVFIGTIMTLLAPVVAKYFFLVSDVLLGWLWTFLQWMSELDLASVSIGSVSTLSVILACIGLFVLGLPRGIPARGLGALLLLPLLFTHVERPIHGSFKFTLLDVGQGLSAVVQTQSHVLVFDTGPKFSPTFDTGKAVVIPFLRHYGWKQLDTLIISHGDNDHLGGAQSVTKDIAVTQVLTSVPNKIHWIANSWCTPGMHWQWDGVDFQMLHPPLEEKKSLRKGNNRSCVLRVSAGDTHVLITGDIEAKAEYYLLKTMPQLLAADVLVMPHHGSKTSSTLEFLHAVQPRYALIGVGEWNRFHLPAPSVIERYEQVGISVMGTDVHGAIEFTVASGHQLSRPVRYREQRRHYWSTGPSH